MLGEMVSKYTKPKPDPRKQRTRDELLAAFFKLVLSRRYHEIRIADILSEPPAPLVPPSSKRYLIIIFL